MVSDLRRLTPTRVSFNFTLNVSQHDTRYIFKYKPE